MPRKYGHRDSAGKVDSTEAVSSVCRDGRLAIERLGLGQVELMEAGPVEADKLVEVSSEETAPAVR